MSEVRTIIVTGQEPLGPTRQGGSLYEVEATDAEGQEIDLPLRSFTELPQGEPIEVWVKPYDSEAHGRTWTISPKERQSRSAKKIADLTKRVEELEERLRAIEADMLAPDAFSELDERLLAVESQLEDA